MKTDRTFGCKPELQFFAPRVLIKRLSKSSVSFLTVPFLTVSVLALSLGAAFSASPVQAQALPGIYTNSWLGNTYGLPADHIPHNFDNLSITPSGKVATITQWEEGGACVVLYSATGAKIGVPVGSGTRAWGRHSGWAVFANDSYVYQTMMQTAGTAGWSPDPLGITFPMTADTRWGVIRRYNHDGTAAPFTGGMGLDGSMLVVNSATNGGQPSGVTVLNNELYASDWLSGTIKVYNATTMSQTPVRSFAIANVGALDYDRLGFIWMLDTVQKKLIRFSSTGAIQPQSISFPANVTATSFCIDRVNDRILAGNAGNDQNVLIYTNIFGTPSQTSTFGNTGGINSGVAGLIAPLKFSEPRGVGIDSAGNIFVGNNAISGGGRLEKYSSSGTLLWRLNGTIATANGSLNPSDETEFYTHEHKFKLNLANTTPGSEWSLVAQTLNKVKYPNDTRIKDKGVFYTTAYTRMVGGKKLLYTSDMVGKTLAVFRFNAATDGETAIPSGLFYNGDKEGICRDANGDGTFGIGETEEKAADSPYTTHFFPDANGGVWKANRDSGSGNLRYFPLQGFDAKGNPQYTYSSSENYRTPEVFDVKRLEYDAANDVLYAAGRSIQSISDSDWGFAGDRLVRYNNFRGTRTTAWSIALPHSTTSPASDLNVKAIAEAGDYLFLAANLNGRIYVHKKTDGSKVGEILPFSSTGNRSGWSDINGAIRATKRSNGEYLIFAEENGFAKVMMYRWKPTAVAPTGVNLLTNSSFDAEAFDTQTPSGWSEWSSNGIGGVGSGYTESNGGSNSGARHGTHYNTGAYNMYTSQTKTDLPNGLYTLRAYARRSGNQTACVFEAKDFGGTTMSAAIPVSSTYQLVEIKDINVTNGKCTVGLWSDGAANDFVFFDDVTFIKQPLPQTNLIINPSFDAEAFDTQTPSGWTEQEFDANWNQIPATSSYVESYGGSNSGTRHGTHYKDAPYRVYTYQQFTGLANGLYTLKAYARRSGNQTNCYLEAQGFGGTAKSVNVPASSSYQLIEVKDINVTNGQCTVGFWTVGGTWDWSYFDDVSFAKQ